GATRQNAVTVGPASETRTKIGESAMQVAPSNSAPSAGFMGPPMLLPFGSSAYFRSLSVARCTPVEFFDMAAPHFVHLRMHSEYSVTDGIVRIEQAVKRAAADGMPALALTDSANLFGMVKFYGAARAAGVKPIIGADCWVENEAERDKPSRLLLLCASRAGYRRLCELLSRAWLTNQQRGRALIARAWLEERSEGLIALSGFVAGELAAPLLSEHGEAAERIARRWGEVFRGRYYIEVQRAGHANGEALLARSI